MAEHLDLLATPALGGWRMAGPGGFRLVSDGVVESFGGPGLFWYADAAFADFALAVDWRLTTIEDNSGVFLRIPPLGNDPGPAIEQGYEVQIDDRGLDPDTGRLDSPLHRTGALYRLAPALGARSLPVGAWNRFQVRARGTVIEVMLNGHTVSRLDTAARRRHGHIGLQNHHDGSAVRFRRLQVERL